MLPNHSDGTPPSAAKGDRPPQRMMTPVLTVSEQSRPRSAKRPLQPRSPGLRDGRRLDGRDLPAAVDEAPLRAELFSIGQLERYALTLAESHRGATTEGRWVRRDWLLARLDDNEGVLEGAHALVTDAVARGRQITPAAEWFIDNFHLIEEQIRLARRHLPPGYSRELPRPVAGPSSRAPRVYDLALQLISHAHGRVDLDALQAFVTSYQSVQPLLLGELWAIPIMLRLALLENLRRVVTEVTAGRRDRERAGEWAERMLDVASTDPARVVLVLGEMIQADPPLTDAFVAELTSRLQGQGPALVYPVAWLEQRLAERGQTIEHAYRLTIQSQGADQVSIANSIGSLRFLTATDWREFVESMSVVEKALRCEPTGVYARMDFATRDRYRHSVEAMAKRSRRPEVEVARAAVALAALVPAADGPRSAHLGYYLIDAGQPVLERAVGIRVSRLRHLVARVRLPLYLGAMLALAGGSTALVAGLSPRLGTGGDLGVGTALAFWSLVAFCALHIAVAVVQWVATLVVHPRLLPRLDLTAGLSAGQRTAIVVPTLLTEAGAIDDQLDQLEVRYLANRDPELYFGLLTDFCDAATERLPSDDALRQRAHDGIVALNDKYASAAAPPFFLCHRARRWNAREEVWMGWERKRGKLEDFNGLVRGATDRFALTVGAIDALQGTAYVIVLDADTELPRDSARLLVGTLDHPLNRPVLSGPAGNRRVSNGYTILQPRVGVTMQGASTSRFARLFAGEPGIDPYTQAVSDVYQDLFGEGSFVGKGIYAVDAMRESCAGRFPDNRVLSHDLLEGAHGRAGLVCDVILYEDHPASHAADISRRARWIRGDWQIARWLLPRVPGGDGRTVANTISLLSKWKIVDNLRRSLVPIALWSLLVIGWLVPVAALAATATVLGSLFLAGFFVATASLARRPMEVGFRQHLREVAAAHFRHVLREGFALACLPFDAALNGAAIARALGRTMLTRRRLLEWRTAADSARAGHTSLARSYATMWTTPLSAVTLTLALLLQDSPALPLALPVLALWLVAPAIAWWLSTPIVDVPPRLSADDLAFLHMLARRTWHYFETTVSAEDNDLPPDNMQEEPPVGIAHRTSPTNIGCALAANLAAYDFGYATVGELIARTSRTFATLDRLPRFHGHFFNWYDTRTLVPLEPMYVSTVDSGNLTGLLLTLAAGLDEIATHPVFSGAVYAGLADTLAVIVASAEPPLDSAAVLAVRALLPRAGDTVAPSLSQHARTLVRLAATTRSLAVAADAHHDAALSRWVDALAAQIATALIDLQHLAPWLEVPFPETPISLWADIAGAPASVLASLDQVGTLSELAASDVPEMALGAARARARLAELRSLARRCHELADHDLELFYNPAQHLLAIGYNVVDHRLDAGYYDLLASEARLASYVAIALGKLPQEHWFYLGRQLTSSTGRAALLSWSGSMFEYLMPLIVMPSYAGTLLDTTCRAVVARQIEYGRERGVPWGVSESGYNKTDAHSSYQYKSFGVPGLGFKRGLVDDIVVAPYASALALMVAPEAACANLRRLDREGRQGALGLYEAIDYTPSRLPPGVASVTVRSYMAHHQGMSLLALAHLLCDSPMQRRFSADPALRATDLLLQERVPRVPAIYPHPAELTAPRMASDGARDLRVITSPDTPAPEVNLLSNGRYHVAITNAGGGSSRWRELAVTRWHADATRDAWGSFCYLRDVASGSFWSAAHQPTTRRASHYEAIFSPGRAEFRRSDEDLETHVEITVSPEDDIEFRRISITNVGRAARLVELTSYAEVVLAPAADNSAHPAFSNLFIETELVRQHQAIICTRRPRSASERPPWMIHLMTVLGPIVAHTTYETARAAFLGRGRTVSDPLAMHRAALSDSEGAVLDPIVSIRNTVAIGVDETVQIHLVTGVAETREHAMALIEKYTDRHSGERVFGLAWTQSQVMQRRLEVTSAELNRYDRLAGYILYSNPALRAPRSVLAKNRVGQSGLWAHGISGDLPIVVLRIADIGEIDLLRQLVRAHTYWRNNKINVDLVVFNDDPSGYRQSLHDAVIETITALSDAALVDRPGGFFVRRGDQLSDQDNVLIQTVARVILSDTAGTIAAQLERRARAEVFAPPFVPLHEPSLRRFGVQPSVARLVLERPDLTAFNGIGGFTQDGREYVITTSREVRTPAPWSNVLANPWFGTVVSESGGAYTWCENAHNYRLTPWHNDPISDTSGEALYLRDEHDGHYWSPTPLPAGGANPYLTRHGFGYSVFETTEEGVASSLCVFVATDAPVKFLKLSLRNRSGRRRRLSLTAVFELVMGSQRSATAPHLVSEVDLETGALFARNAYSTEFPQRITFLESSVAARTVTGDRQEVLGRNGELASPSCMNNARLSGRVGAGLDPCLAMQLMVDLADGEARELVLMFGSGRDLDDARHLVNRFRGVGPAEAALELVWSYWKRVLGEVHVQTPDPALDVLTNGWLIYQVLACRMWGRSGYYQSGGAFGFRDQLQDVAALIHATPAIAREHLLRSAAHQFPEGDVQHWWHPPLGRGVRTRISDDYLWLPSVVCRYVTALGDIGVLDEQVAFIEGRAVKPEEESYFDLPIRSEQTATLYEHCVRALKHGLRFGVHGLPLMGSGDWNDGMNLVGIHGQGESVWLGFFLYDVLTRFAELATRRGDGAFAETCTSEAQRLQANLEAHGWDGEWYRRAYFDSGMPLGSKLNAECAIDSLPQSWAVLSGAGAPDRTSRALASLDAHLVDRKLGVIRLFDPPFDHADMDPGYVKGYVPGVRENGGQYTHAAVWAAMAFAAAGNGPRAWELLDLINPVHRTADPAAANRYMVEPYVVAADVYTNPQHGGRGGWTWYTGSAGWMYRLVVESLLGVHLEVDHLRITPLVPPEWPAFDVHYRWRDTMHHIHVVNATSGDGARVVVRVVADGVVCTDQRVPLHDDQSEHWCEVTLGPVL